MQSADGVQVNIERIASLFPDCVTETIVGYDADDRPILRHKVDFEKLQQNLSSEIISGKEERYQFTWPDKKRQFCWLTHRSMQRFDLVEMRVWTSITQKTCI